MIAKWSSKDARLILGTLDLATTFVSKLALAVVSAATMVVMARCQSAHEIEGADEQNRERTFLVQCQLEEHHLGQHEAAEAQATDDGQRATYVRQRWD